MNISTKAAITGLLLLPIAALAYIPAEKPVQAPQPVSDLTVANLLLEVNQERTKAGAAPLAIDPRLNQSAQLKADEIASTGVFEHIGKDGKSGLDYIREAGVGDGCVFISENLAADTTTKGAVNDWLISKSHKDAMLETRYDSTGFGISDGPGYSHIVQHFCDLP